MIHEVYEEAMSCAIVFLCHRRFKNSQEDIENDHLTERSSTSQTEGNLVKVCELLNTKHRLSVRIIANELQLNQTMVYKLVTEDSQMRKVSPKVLKNEQKGWQRNASMFVRQT